MAVDRGPARRPGQGVGTSPTEGGHMDVTRRGFVKAAGMSGIGALAIPLIGARGSEAFRDGIIETSSSARMFDADERAPYRIASPGAIRLDSNENPNGPGQATLD